MERNNIIFQHEEEKKENEIVFHEKGIHLDHFNNNYNYNKKEVKNGESNNDKKQ